MFDNRNNSNCPRQDQIVSYLYREMTTAETERFEAHLATCSSCVDELAAVSEPRLSVYEWRTNVFDKIPAPSIRLPLVKEQRAHSEGLLGRLTALLAGWPAGLRVGVGFATVLILAVSVFILTRPFAGTEVARSVDVPKADDRSSIAEPSLSRSEGSSTVVVPPEVDHTVSEPSIPVHETGRARREISDRRTLPTARTGRTEVASNRKAKTTTQRSLRLNNFDDDEDTTLRLADILEEVGSL